MPYPVQYVIEGHGEPVTVYPYDSIEQSLEFDDGAPIQSTAGHR